MFRPGRSALVLAAVAVLASCQQLPEQRSGTPSAAPTFAVDPAWPKPLPENWLLGQVAGEFKWVHNMAIDSKGNLYTAEVGTGRRAQKFKRVE
jgi:hypothetical protein